MSIGYNDVKERKEEIERELTKIYGFEKKYPKGELLCARNDSRYKWYLKEQGKTSYLPKNKRELGLSSKVCKFFFTPLSAA